MSDISDAQTIVSGKKFNFNQKDIFHPASFIYKVTNENIRSYYHLLLDRKSVLTVIGSGDQVLNHILSGSKEIECFDISTFPKYFLFLKIAALHLRFEEYLEYIDTFDIHYFDRICKYMDTNTLNFWSSLYDYFDYQTIYNSPLFSTELCTKDKLIEKNPYLDKEHYYILQGKVKEIKLDIKTIDILDYFPTKSYDFINLSNIYTYIVNSFQEYHDFLKKFSLNDDGLILTYLFDIYPALKEICPYFPDVETYERSGVIKYKKPLSR